MKKTPICSVCEANDGKYAQIVCCYDLFPQVSIQMLYRLLLFVWMFQIPWNMSFSYFWHCFERSDTFPTMDSLRQFWSGSWWVRGCPGGHSAVVGFSELTQNTTFGPIDPETTLEIRQLTGSTVYLFQNVRLKWRVSFIRRRRSGFGRFQVRYIEVKNIILLYTTYCTKRCWIRLYEWTPKLYSRRRF